MSRLANISVENKTNKLIDAKNIIADYLIDKHNIRLLHQIIRPNIECTHSINDDAYLKQSTGSNAS